MKSKCYTCVHCCLGFCCIVSLALMFSVVQRCVVSPVFFNPIAPICSRRIQLLQLLRCFCNCQQSTHHECSSAVWLVEHLVACLFGNAFPLPFIYLGSWGLLQYCMFGVVLAHFILVYFDWLPLNVFQCDLYPCLCCLIIFRLFLCCGGVSRLVCGYCWSSGCFHLTGVGHTCPIYEHNEIHDKFVRHHKVSL